MIGPGDKGFGPCLWGRRVSEIASVSMDALVTPVLTLDRGALRANAERMLSWTRSLGLQLAPHGKSTMTPALWRDLRDAGAWGLTLATPWQVMFAWAHGVRRIMLANPLTDMAVVDWLAAELDGDADASVWCWADDATVVRALDTRLAAIGATRRLPVLVELGRTGGRGGARSMPAAVAVAHAISEAAHLELAGVAGYEGVIAHDRSAVAIAAVDTYLADLEQLHRELARSGLYPGRPVVTAGGSLYPDRVAAVLGQLAGEADVVLRSGSFHTHDDGVYQRLGPFGTQIPGASLRSAIHVWSRVLSRPEPDLLVLDAGRRDLSADIDLPQAQLVLDREPSAAAAALAGAVTVAIYDQHLLVRLARKTVTSGPRPGEVVRLGVSHPCTTMDKWPLIPVIDDASATTPRVVGAVETAF